MSEALKILQELRENKRYSYMYDRIDTAIKELLAQPEQEPLSDEEIEDIYTRQWDKAIHGIGAKDE